MKRTTRLIRIALMWMLVLAAGVLTMASCDTKDKKETHTHAYEDGACTICGAPCPSDGLEFTLNKDGGSYSVTGMGTCTDKDVVIPDSYDGKPVTGIGYTSYDTLSIYSSINDGSTASTGNEAFWGLTDLTSVMIPDSVTSIGLCEFSGCTGLTSITIPDSVTIIGKYAFSGCTSLTNITVDPNNSTYHSAGDCLIATRTKEVIVGCTNSVIPMDGSVTGIHDGAFFGCSGLTDITIPDSVTSIGNEAFQGCTGLTNIIIPDSVTSIGENAFRCCTSLSSVTIPDTVTSIDRGAFSYCENLTSIIVAKGNTAYHVAGNCLIETVDKTLIAGFKNSVIPTDGSVARIGYYAFDGCTALTNIAIPNSVTVIGGCAFQGCTGLTSITIPDSVMGISYYAFQFCSDLTSITYTGTMAQWSSIQKAEGWAENTASLTIHCTDGDISG